MDSKQDLVDEIARLRAALKVARQWMPVQPIEDAAKVDVAMVDAALDHEQGVQKCGKDKDRCDEDDPKGRIEEDRQRAIKLISHKR